MTVTRNLHYGLTAWASSTLYNTLGVRRSNGGNAYQVTAIGTSAASGGPTGTGASITDGSVTWKWLSAIDHSDLPAWITAVNGATPLTQPWVLLVWNDGEIVVSAGVNLTGTSSATNYILIRPAPGEAWNDNANVRTNAFAYNPANGAAIKFNMSHGTAFGSHSDAVYIRDMQLYAPFSPQGLIGFNNESLTDACQVDRCILKSNNNHGSFLMWAYVPATNGVATKITGSLFQAMGSSTRCIAVFRDSGAYSCTFFAPSDAGNNQTCITHSYAASTPVKNCAIYGWSAGALGSGTITYTNCATDSASPPTGVTQVTPYSSQFQGTTIATADARLKAGAGLIDTGANDGSGLTTDASNTARGTLWDIGAWEAASAGPPPYRARVVRWG